MAVIKGKAGRSLESTPNPQDDTVFLSIKDGLSGRCIATVNLDLDACESLSCELQAQVCKLQHKRALIED